MASLKTGATSLHLIWTFSSNDTSAARSVRHSLDAGHSSRLFDLVVWDFQDNQAHAILSLAAPFEDVVAAIWHAGHPPVSLRLAEHAGSVALRNGGGGARSELRGQNVRNRLPARRKQ